MELSTLFSRVRRRAWLLVAAMLLAGAAGILISRISNPVYEAEAQVLVGPVSGDFQELRAAGNLAQTYAELVKRTPVLRAGIRRAGVDISPQSLQRSLFLRANELTRILTINVRHGDPGDASKLANGLAAELVAQAGVVNIIESAQPPTSPASPSATFVAPLAAIAGLLGAFVVIITVETLGDRVHEPADVESLTKVPCVPVPTARRRRSFLRLPRRRRPGAGLSLLSEALDARAGERSLRVIAVIPSENNTAGAEISLGLAELFGTAGHDVFLFDTDRRQVLTSWFGVLGRPGLGELLSYTQGPGAATELEMAIRTGDSDNFVRGFGIPTQVPGTTLLAGGTQSSGLRDAELGAKILQRAANEADRVVVSSGAPRVDSDSLKWARASDGAVLVVTAGQSRRSEVTEAVRNLKLADIRLVAAVLRQPS